MHDQDVNTKKPNAQRGGKKELHPPKPATAPSPRPSSKAVPAQIAHNAHARINTITLFGSQRLVRDGDTGAWVFTSAATKPKKLSRREAVFINAALHAAGV